MATTPTTPTTPTPEPVTAPPKPDPTPLNPPVMYYNQKWSVPGIMVTTQEQADALDPTEWVPTSASAVTPSSAASKEQYPQLWYNVNVAPKIVGSADEAKALGSEYKEFNLPDSLCKAAEANNAAKAQAASAQGQTQAQSQPPGQ